ncbi:response regulator transcription factor [Jeotgalibacillus proteolyticus]|uniref:DNA-binding response regulator n=1 Tax=Jeotgalibacillus proteolyticus TaxID=2082395 RepID=A0A2S5GBE6_9BACL|nr:helix-turn-helix domain-containing protein [Jeotgalibacillus proteolyticus]PPA70234.1 DNA-binding response regulator [Jeotgalibacillus proteolyticus]
MNNKVIMVVDDEETTRRGLRKTLIVWSNGRYEILTASTAGEALAHSGKTKIHILITDICMPEMTGLELVKEMKESGQQPVTLMISGHSQFEFAQEAIRLGVLNYLVKPVSKAKLIEAVEEALVKEESIERAGIIEKSADLTLLQVNREQEQAKNPVKTAYRYVDDHIHRQISLKEVADHVHLNSSYFSVLFKEQAGLTFSEYVTRIRLQHAKQLLAATGLPIAQIAEESGYQTAKYFNKIFKEYEGMTPGAYRKSLR